MPIEMTKQDDKIAKMFNTYHGRLEKINEETMNTDLHQRKNTDLVVSDRVYTDGNKEQIQNDNMVTVEKPKILRP